MSDVLDKMISEMPVVIFAGGKGINLGKNGEIIPKPMVEINGTPILKSIMEIYANAGLNNFIICTGAGGEMIKRFIPLLPKQWKVSVVETGNNSMTGSRLAQAESLLSKHPAFCLTYGDTISDINIRDVIAFHMNHKRTATLLAVHAPIRFRILGLRDDDDQIKGLSDKPVLEKDYINGGFYVINNGIFKSPKLSTDPKCVLETDVLEDLISKKEVFAYRYNGYWQYLDNDRDRQKLSEHFILRGQGK